MTEEDINAVAVMRRAGNSNREIAVAEPKQAIIDFCKSNNIRQGRISNMMLALSKEEKVWLVGEAHKDGYETIAEWLTDLVREKYDIKNEL